MMLSWIRYNFSSPSSATILMLPINLIFTHKYQLCIKILLIVVVSSSGSGNSSSSSSIVYGNILQSVLGLPSECVHHNKIRPCKLSFSCWLQGGKHAQGCGNNKWLFSCCISEKDALMAAAAAAVASAAVGHSSAEYASMLKHGGKMNHHQQRKPNYPVGEPPQQQRDVTNRPSTKLKLKYGKRNILKRRTDDISLHQQECGVSKNAQNTIQKRIIGGRTAHFAEYPWQAHIRIAEFQCGGVLATAAHCIQQARIKDIVVYLGELDTQNSGVALEPLPAEKHRVIKKMVHPRFQFRITQPDRYDLALLQLASPTVFKNHILPICLPTTPINLIGRKGVIAGWGKTQASMGHAGTNILQSAAVPILNMEDCINWHDSKQINVELFDEMFCAGHQDGHQDACLGDSGGPLIVKDGKGRYTLVGITSAGFGCGIDHQPGIYHNVQLTSKWIQEIIYKSF